MSTHVNLLYPKLTTSFWDPYDCYFGVPDSQISGHATDLLSVLRHQHLQRGQYWQMMTVICAIARNT